jgi:hypothetical protein
LSAGLPDRVSRFVQPEFEALSFFGEDSTQTVDRPIVVSERRPICFKFGDCRLIGEKHDEDAVDGT